MTIILGIDPGSRITGYGIINENRQNAWQKADRIPAVREWQTDGCRNLISAPLDRVNAKSEN